MRAGDMRRITAALLAAAALAACTTPAPRYPPPTGPQGPSRPVIVPEIPPPQPERPTEPAPPRTLAQASGPAVVALLGKARTRGSAGDYGHASALVERALDLEPRNAFIYHRLASIRIEQGKPQQAEALARKSNSLAVDNPYLQTQNWSLIAKARRIRGDGVGAAAADSRADYYRSLWR
ncbi:MAG: hypothetical protein L0H19_04110 [Salinisphaera sp.]|nr:hypothetical protein [Salinisphaera sp.]MDN5938224.1 hypothetical protein [Salinisphaera sp.]